MDKIDSSGNSNPINKHKYQISIPQNKSTDGGQVKPQIRKSSSFGELLLDDNEHSPADEGKLSISSPKHPKFKASNIHTLI